jgi:hypothetical protein
LSWAREFEELVSLPDGRTLVTLRDAALYITDLSSDDGEGALGGDGLAQVICVMGRISEDDLGG